MAHHKSSYSSKSSRSSRSSRSSHSSHSSHSSGTSCTSRTSCTSSSSYNENDVSFEEKQKTLNEMLDSIEHSQSLTGNNAYKDGDWCKVDKFLHISEDRLSTVGSGHIIDNRDINFIWKVCEAWDYTIFAEMNIMKRLEEMFEWNPHFVRAFNIIEVPLHPSFACEPKKYVPFQSKYRSKYDPIKRMCKNQFLLMEELKGHLSVYDYFYIVGDHSDGNKVNNIIYSIMIQTLLSIYNANKYCEFTHYDLHTSNVLMEDTDDDFRLYISEGGNYFIKTYGLSTVVIDTGYSYADSLKNGCIDTCITSFPTGYTPICSNINHDFRTFMLNIVWDYPTDSSETKTMKKTLKEFVEKHYKHKHIDMKTGWLQLNKDKIFVLKNYIRDLTKLCSKKSIFYEYEVQCFDVLTHIIKLPLSSSSSDINMKQHKELFTKFFNYFVHIENKCGNSITFRKYLWKTIVHIFNIHIFKDEYSDDFERDLKQLFSEYNIVINNFEYQKFYQSLKDYIPCYEQAIVKAYNEIEKQNIIDFSKVPEPDQILENIRSMFSKNININVTEDDIIFVYDAIKKTKTPIKIPSEDISRFNDMNNTQKTDYLVEIYNN